MSDESIVAEERQLWRDLQETFVTKDEVRAAAVVRREVMMFYRRKHELWNTIVRESVVSYAELPRNEQLMLELSGMGASTYIGSFNALDVCMRLSVLE